MGEYSERVPVQLFLEKVDSTCDLQNILTTIHAFDTCQGNPDEQFLSVMNQ